MAASKSTARKSTARKRATPAPTTARERERAREAAPAVDLEDARRATARDADVGQAEVEERLQAEQKRGYVGVTPDPIPNSAYTVSGLKDGAGPGALLTDAGRLEQPVATADGTVVTAGEERDGSEDR